MSLPFSHDESREFIFCFSFLFCNKASDSRLAGNQVKPTADFHLPKRHKTCLYHPDIKRTSPMQTLRIFISSPGDVAEERQITGKVIERLQGKYWSFVRLHDVFWEQKVVRSTAHYQDELINPGDCEMVLGILWSRLGSPLPEKFRKRIGERL